MTPTPKLRFVERQAPVPFQNFKDVVQMKTVRILQQWWENREKTIGVSQTGDGPMVKHHPGEWRDVPIELVTAEALRIEAEYKECKNVR